MRISEEEKILSEELSKQMDEKQKMFDEIKKNNPDKKVVNQKIIIEWEELVDIKKDELRFEENDEDRKYNKNVFMSRSKYVGLEAIKFAKSIQDVEAFAIKEFTYAGGPACFEGKFSIPKGAICLNEAPAHVKRAFVNILSKLADAAEIEIEPKTHDDIINEEIEQEHAEAEARKAETGDKAVDDFLNGKTDELPEGTEEISTEEAVALENATAASAAN